MKTFYEVIFKVYEEIEQDISNDNIPYAIDYAKEGVRSLYMNLLFPIEIIKGSPSNSWC